MNFNFKEILEMFSGHWRFLALLILVSALIGGFVIVPLGKSYFESDSYSCSEVLDENEKLIQRIVRISGVLREYSELAKAQESMNKSVSEMVVESAIDEDAVAPPIQVVDQANETLNKEKNKLIKKAKELAETDN